MRSTSAWKKRSAKSHTGSPFAASVGVHQQYAAEKFVFFAPRETSPLIIV